MKQFGEEEAAMLCDQGLLHDRPVGLSSDQFVTALHVVPQEAQPDEDFGTTLEWT